MVHQGCTYFGTSGDDQWAYRHPKTQAGSSQSSQPMQAGGGSWDFAGKSADIQGVPLCGAFPLSAIQQKGYTTEKCLAPRTRIETELVGTYKFGGLSPSFVPGGLRTLGQFFSTRMG